MAAKLPSFAAMSFSGITPSPADAASYARSAAERDRWILSRRGARNPVESSRPYAFLVEEERAESGEVVPVATIFLTNRECPWRCLMCDLWKNTLAETVPAGAIPAQIDFALAQLPPSRQIKLYNSGSFFDPRAIPTEDHPAIAERVRAFDRVIVECHPSLVRESALRFRDLLVQTNGSRRREEAEASRDSSGPPPHVGGYAAPAMLEVAMGLETVHPEVLPKLNKRMTLEQFSRSAGFLRQHDIALRVFVLVKPPFLDEAEALEWAGRSVDFAFDCGASVVSLIPTRLGNGALETLASRREFAPPKLATFEAAFDYAVGLRRGRVFADTWDLERFSNCPACFAARRERLARMNLSQEPEAQVACDACAESESGAPS